MRIVLSAKVKTSKTFKEILRKQKKMKIFMLAFISVT